MFLMKKEMKGLLVFIVVLSMLCDFSISKECTNIPTQLSINAAQNIIRTSNDENYKQEMHSQHEHDHLTPSDESTWATLRPGKTMEMEDQLKWAMEYKKMKSPLNSVGNFLKEVPLRNVRLMDPSSIHYQAQQTNLEYLLMLDVDKLVFNFRKTAGLDAPGSTYGGWENTSGELRGHFVGHYLSATARMWASTQNDTLKTKMDALMSALSACQEKMGSGYLSAFSTEEFDRVEVVKPVWAPYYTIHKILAGLLDQYTFADNAQALKMVKWMVEYFYNRVQNIIGKYSVELHYLSLNTESGGMNDVLYKLFTITNDPKHLALARLFDKPCFLGVLAMQSSDIAGFHTNTHIPIVIGTQMRYEITGEPLYKDMGTYFMYLVNSSHAYATGGTSVGELWSDPRRLATTLQAENEESCTTYNMLKVSRHLFRWTKEMAYADYYERALTNGVLGIQRGTEPGVMIYMLPLAAGSSKARSHWGWGKPFDAFWCCYGTGIESFSKLGDSIYFEQQGKRPGLYIIQHISSAFEWTTGQVLINQQVDPVVSSDPQLRVTLTFTPQGSGLSSTLNLRIPIWTSSAGAKATLNGRSLSLPAPGNFLSVTNKWSSKTELTLQLPIILRTESIKDDRSEYASLQAILYGPYLLAGHTTADWELKPRSATSLSDWITPIPAATYNSHLVSFSQGSANSTFFLTNKNQSLTMQISPISGTDAALQATFRLIINESSSSNFTIKDAIGKSVMLEPFDLPGMVLVQQENDGLAIANSATAANGASTFHLVPGLDGNNGTVSLESGTKNGCYVYNTGQGMKLSCVNQSSADGRFKQGASFVMNQGLSEYHPISFVAKGVKRDFLLEPLFNYRDESYTVYFKFCFLTS